MFEKIWLGAVTILWTMLWLAIVSLATGGLLSLGTLWLSSAVTSFDVPALGYWESVAIWLVANLVFGVNRSPSKS
jgi:hypothetical protein